MTNFDQNLKKMVVNILNILFQWCRIWVEILNIWVKILNITMNFSRDVENLGQNLKHYKLGFWSKSLNIGLNLGHYKIVMQILFEIGTPLIPSICKSSHFDVIVMSITNSISPSLPISFKVASPRALHVHPKPEDIPSLEEFLEWVNDQNFFPYLNVDFA